MDDLNPITRTERLLDGEDLTPTNREEMFIKRIYDKTQAIPEPVNRKEYFLKKAGEAGGDVTVVPLSVTDNGIYSEEGKAYSPVTVEVSPPEDSYQLKSITTPTSLATFNASAMPMPKLKVSIVAKQAGSGVPSPDNVRPITGWDAVVVSDVGKNLCEGIISNANIESNGIISSSLDFNMAYGKVKKGETYTITTNEINGFVGGFFTSIPVSGSVSYNGQRIVENNKTFTSPIDGYVTFRVVSKYSYNPQLEIGTSATAYEPYNPNSYTTTITLPQTVYGAEVDVVNGILTITDGYIASYNGETLPSTWISSMDVYAEGTTPTTGAEVCYELTTPTTIPLTPTLIKSLNGTNNLSVDSGDVIEVEYFKALGGE